MKKIKVYGLETSYPKFARICNNIQKAKAKEAILMSDRMKTTLTPTEILNKYAQAGGTLEVNGITFTFEMGMGVLHTPNKQIIGASISDFLAYAN